MNFLRILTLLVLLIPTTSNAELLELLPAPNTNNLSNVPSSSYGSSGNSQINLRPASPEICGARGAHLPSTYGSNCVNQCMCDQYGNNCQWFQFCR